MSPACMEFRIAWLGAEPSASDHVAGCAVCAAWVRSTERSRAALAGLARLQTPAELEQRVRAELSGDRSQRLQRILDSCVRRTAPQELEERVNELLGGDARHVESGKHKAQALRSLDVQPAPDVLERLLNEELAAPERHRVERFSGSLERLEAPLVLRQRVGQAVRHNALTRLVLGPLLTLTAAGLVLWLTVQGGDEERSYRFRVTQATSLSGLDPTARALAESLGGSAGMGTYGEMGTPR